MIKKEELEKYVSITKEIPDENGMTKNDGYNTRYVGQWGVLVHCWLPEDVALGLQEEFKDVSGIDSCHKLSYEHGDSNHRFICTLPSEHDGLCVASNQDDVICAIFDPDEEAPSVKSYALSRLIISAMVDGLVGGKD